MEYSSSVKKIILFTVLLFVSLLMLLTSIYTVSESEQAILTTFGKVTAIQGSGPHIKFPYPIQRVTKLAVNKTQKMLIGYNVDKNAGEIRVLSESKMITGDFNIVNIDFFIEWKISDPVKFKFSSNDPKLILKNIAQASARGIISSKQVDGVLTTEKNIIQTEIKEKIIHKLEAYDLGIQVLDVKIQDSEPPTEEVNKAFKAVETAKQQKETLLNEAYQYKNKTIPEAKSASDKLIQDAESAKTERINQAKGEVARFNEMYKEYTLNKKITATRLYYEMIEKVFPDIPVYIESNNGNMQKLLPVKEFNK